MPATATPKNKKATQAHHRPPTQPGRVQNRSWRSVAFLALTLRESRIRCPFDGKDGNVLLTCMWP